MQHLNEEQLVAHYYHDADAPESASEHLLACAECRAQFDTIGRVLSLVKTAPVPERAEDYGEQVWRTIRWKIGGSSRRSSMRWPAVAAIAAALTMAFIAGLLWRARPDSHPVVVATTASVPSTTSAPQPVATTEEEAPAPDRVLLLVVNGHLESSERMLVEVANANPDRKLATVDQSKRAEDLVSANRLYRQAALQQGDERIAQLLSDIEPILVELSHAGATIDRTKLRKLQRRIETHNLLFKVRVISAQAGDGREAPPPSAGTESL